MDIVQTQKGDNNMFKEGDIVVPSENNAQAVFENPIPKYKICQIGMGRVFAENLITRESVDLAASGEAEYYYKLLKRRE